MKNKVLVIEENTMMRLFLSTYLSKRYTVNSYRSVDEAIENFEHEPDVIVHYYNNYAKQDLISLKQNLILRDIPTMGLTAGDDSAERLEAYRLGISDCLSKPFHPEELVVRLQKLVGRNNSIDRKYKKSAIAI